MLRSKLKQGIKNPLFLFLLIVIIAIIIAKWIVIKTNGNTWTHAILDVVILCLTIIADEFLNKDDFDKKLCLAEDRIKKKMEQNVQTVINSLETTIEDNEQFASYIDSHESVEGQTAKDLVGRVNAIIRHTTCEVNSLKKMLPVKAETPQNPPHNKPIKDVVKDTVNEQKQKSTV